MNLFDKVLGIYIPVIYLLFINLFISTYTANNITYGNIKIL